MTSRGQVLRALLIAPDRELAEQFTRSVTRTRIFEIVADVKAYPTASALESRLMQLKPDVVLLDVASDLEAATELIRHATSSKPPVQVIGLHTQNDSQAILRSLRSGAAEFLYAPFDVSIQDAAIARIQKLLQPESGETEGRLVLFSSAKPGSGASTLALQTAFALRRASAKRVLLADLDLTGGSLAFYLKLEPAVSLADLLENYERLDHAMWSDAVSESGGIDVLAAPAVPHPEPPDPAKLQGLLQYARSRYDWVVADLPTIFDRTALLTLSNADRLFLVSSTELASLHLARRAVKLLSQIGLDTQKFQILVNRMDKRDELNNSDLNKLFNCRVERGLPNDALSLQRAVTLGQPLDGESDLGRALDGLVGKLMGALPDAPVSPPVNTMRPVWSH